jgi:glycosyltransferase involved in cell wall biosynthesis
MKETILIGMPLRNGASTIRRAVTSFLQQMPIRRDAVLLIVDDSSTDDWKAQIQDLLPNPKIIVQRVALGRTYALRNHITQFARQNPRNFDFIARLDADDELVDCFTLQKLDKILDRHSPDVVIMGNRLRIANNLLQRVNRAEKDLLNIDYLTHRLQRMSQGDETAELPSCNTVIRSSVDFSYPEVISAEDHWLTVDLLLRKDQLKIHVADDLFYSIYSLSGIATSANKSEGIYIESRKRLYRYLMAQIGKTI